MADDKYTQSKPFDSLNSRGLTGKREYVRGLEQRADDEALSLLVECLCDESWYLRDQAEQALVRIGPQVATVLLPLLEQGLWFTRTSAARVLGRFGHRPAVPGLLRLAEDANETVADAARDALVVIGQAAGAISIARGLHALPPDVRRQRLDELAARDQHLGERLQRMLQNDELMSADDGDALHDESAMVRAHEEGLEWEVLTGRAHEAPGPPDSPGSHVAGGGRAGSPTP